jgi:hypothetical protein
MGDFGHVATGGDGVFTDSWGVGPFVIETEGKAFRFEDSDRFGPFLLGRSGDPLKVQPGERSPFWRAHRIWVRQGRKTDGDDITCLWAEPKPTTFYHINKRNVMIVEHGEEDGLDIEVAPPGGP